MVDVRAASVDEVRQHWGFVEQGLKKVATKTFQEFIPADVFYEIRSEAVLFYWVIDRGEPAGFVVFSEKLKDSTGEKILFVEHLYLSKTDNHLLREETHEAVEKLAINAGYNCLEASSPRMGWGRLQKQFGWQPVAVVYRRYL